ncbi:MAG: MFS transporter [Bryobacterales bacterium]|nr:MFS transporter [Bryobacterales bacterium]
MKPQWALIAFLWGCYVLNHADRQVVYTLFPALQSEFGLSDAMLGMTGALFLWIYGLCSPIAGILGDRYPRPLMVTGSLAVWSFCTLLTGFSPNGTVLLVLRALLGVSESLFMPAAYALMASAHPPQTRSKAISIFGTSQLVGVAVGGSLSGWLAEHYHWRIAFWALGIAGMLYALPLYRFLQRVPKSFLSSGANQSANLKSFLSLFFIPTLRIVTLFVSIATFGLFLVYTWLPTFLHDKFGLGLARAGVESSVYPQIGSAFGLLIGGMLADKLYLRTTAARFWIIMSAFFLAGPSIFLLGNLSSVETVRMAAIAFSFFSGFIFGNQAAAAFDVVPAATRASSVGVLNLIGCCVSGFAPFLGGLARRTVGVDRVMVLTGGVYLLTGAIVLYGLLRHFRRDHEAALAASAPVERH